MMADHSTSKTWAGSTSDRFLRKLVLVSAPSPLGWQTPSDPVKGCTTGVCLNRFGAMVVAGGPPGGGAGGGVVPWETGDGGGGGGAGATGITFTKAFQTHPVFWSS